MELNPQRFQTQFQQIEAEVGKVMVGQEAVLRRVLLVFLSGRTYFIGRCTGLGKDFVDSNVIRSH